VRDNAQSLLQKLEEDRARFGAHTPAYLRIDIDEATETIANAEQRIGEITRELERLGPERGLRLEPFTTETTDVAEAQTIPPIESVDARSARFRQEGGQESLEGLLLEKSKIEKAKEVIPALERYIERYEKAIDPLRCCVSIVIAYERLRRMVSDFESSGQESVRSLLKSKSQEIIDLFDDPCVYQLQEWGEMIEPPANRSPLALITEETLQKYGDSCQKARECAVALARPDVLDDIEQARAVLRQLGTNALIMQEAWRTPHGRLYAEIQSTIRFVDAILGA
jgi:hypothetical protein